MIDWDDLRTILAVDRSGSAMAAADVLGVNASTVQRRISRFEQAHGIRLFERRQSGFKATPDCAALVAVAADIEERVNAVSREILGRDFRLEGILRVTSVDTFMNARMAAHFARFRAMHPKIRLEVTLTNNRLDLSRQDADVAIRPSHSPPDNLVGRDFRLEGILRVTSVDTFMNARMAAHFARFRAMHPKIRLEVTLTNNRLDLSRQDADVAIRPSHSPPDNLVGQRVARLLSAVYAKRGGDHDVGLQTEPSQLLTQDWIGLGEMLDSAPPARWMRDRVAADRISMTVDTFPAVCAALEADLGIGVLPCVVGDRNPNLVRVTPPLEETAVDLWVLTHPEIRSAAKVRAFMEFITATIRREKALFEGILENSAFEVPETQPLVRNEA
ncbi:MAG: LysR substrate-binding domain-containing protein [Pseudomonadota bacterium]